MNRKVIALSSKDCLRKHVEELELLLMRKKDLVPKIISEVEESLKKGSIDRQLVLRVKSLFKQLRNKGAEHKDHFKFIVIPGIRNKLEYGGVFNFSLSLLFEKMGAYDSSYGSSNKVDELLKTIINDIGSVEFDYQYEREHQVQSHMRKYIFIWHYQENDKTWLLEGEKNGELKCELVISAFGSKLKIVKSDRVIHNNNPRLNDLMMVAARQNGLVKLMIKLYLAVATGEFSGPSGMFTDKEKEELGLL